MRWLVMPAVGEGHERLRQYSSMYFKWLVSPLKFGSAAGTQ
jgi:hypothetical protein